MAADLKALEKQLRDNPNPEKSAETLVTGVADLLDALTHDPVAIKKLAADLRAAAPALGVAVVAGTTATQPANAGMKPPESHPDPSLRGRGPSGRAG